MVHDNFTHQLINQRRGGAATHLKFHADNCAGQNKNRYVLWYMYWQGWMGIEVMVDLLLLDYGYTKRRGGDATNLIFHAYNCAGQNKNRYVL